MTGFHVEAIVVNRELFGFFFLQRKVWKKIRFVSGLGEKMIKRTMFLILRQSALLVRESYSDSVVFKNNEAFYAQISTLFRKFVG